MIVPLNDSSIPYCAIVHCDCGYTFYTNFPLQSGNQSSEKEKRDKCPNCNKYHLQPDKNTCNKKALVDWNNNNQFNYDFETRTRTFVRNCDIQPSINSGDTLITCSCGHDFYTDFPLESDPPQAQCPGCNKLHQDPTVYSDSDDEHVFKRAYADFNDSSGLDSIQIGNCYNDTNSTHIHCSCGNQFYTNFPLESDPPQARCNVCRQLHRRCK